jgi:hypothetical protein
VSLPPRERAGSDAFRGSRREQIAYLGDDARPARGDASPMLEEEGVHRYPIGRLKLLDAVRRSADRFVASAGGGSSREALHHTRPLTGSTAELKLHVTTSATGWMRSTTGRAGRGPSNVDWLRNMAAGCVRVTGVYPASSERTRRACPAQQKAPARKGASWNFAISASS